jgi:glycosyltransferase involved in cell wall biosynthesis
MPAGSSIAIFIPPNNPDTIRHPWEKVRVLLTFAMMRVNMTRHRQERQSPAPFAAPCHFLYLIGQLSPGGSERQLVYLLEQLKRRQYSPHVVVGNYCEDDPYVAKIRALEVPLHALPPQGARLSKILALRRLVWRLRPEVVHSYSAFTNVATWWATLGTGAVPIGSLRSDILWEEQDTGVLLGRLNMRWPRSQIYNSAKAMEMARQHHRFFVPKHLFVIRNGIDLQRFHASSLPLDGPVCLVGVGSLLPVKRWDRLMRAAVQLRQQGLTFQARIIGDGPLRRALQQEVQRLGLAAVVKLPGYSDDVPKDLAAATFTVHVAAAEGCPNAVMEAMACGRAVVAMAAGDVPALVEDGKMGFVVPQDDEARLVHCLATLITDRQLCRRMGEAGRRKAEQAFGLERLVAETLAAYRVAGWREHR